MGGISNPSLTPLILFGNAHVKIENFIYSYIYAFIIPTIHVTAQMEIAAMFAENI